MVGATTQKQRCTGEGGQGCWSLGDPKRCSGACLFPPEAKGPMQTTTPQNTPERG